MWIGSNNLKTMWIGSNKLQKRSRWRLFPFECSVRRLKAKESQLCYPNFERKGKERSAESQ